MKRFIRWRKSHFSLQVKLALSYLGVTLGAILLLVLVITVAVQNYFYQSQIGAVQANANYDASQLAQAYNQNNNSWNGPSLVDPRMPLASGILVIVDAHRNLLTAVDPSSDATLEKALTQALQGRSAQGTGTFAVGERQTPQSDGNDQTIFPGFYASAPIKWNNTIVGALLLIQINRRIPGGFSTYDFLANVDQAILIAGLGITLVVIAFSLILTRRLTKPLVSLTRAAEQMKAGNYTQRADQPQSLDELGRLALTFNSMADKLTADIYEQRQQEQLRRDMIANIAHDLVTPLTAIQGYSEAIADDVISDPIERQETALLIGREVQRLRRLVSDMQNMTSLEAGRLQLEIAPLNLHDLVEETLAVISPECQQADIELHNEIALGTPLALVDSDRLTQVLLNLLDNARRHTPAGGKIVINARNDGEQIIMSISDTGVGIQPLDLPHIFERFYRVDRSRNAASGGSGLGLAIIKAIIVAHGGTVWAESTPGHGTTIFFTLRQARLLPPVERKSDATHA
jgi:two-component system, OmpR family, sensor histidine kinase BaeS